MNKRISNSAIASITWQIGGDKALSTFIRFLLKMQEEKTDTLPKATLHEILKIHRNHVNARISYLQALNLITVQGKSISINWEEFEFAKDFFDELSTAGVGAVYGMCVPCQNESAARALSSLSDGELNELRNIPGQRPSVYSLSDNVDGIVITSNVTEAVEGETLNKILEQQNQINANMSKIYDQVTELVSSCFPGYTPVPAPVNQEVKEINIKDGEVDVVVGEPDDNEEPDEQSPSKPKKKMKDKRRLGIPDDAPEDPRDAMFNAIVGWTPESENYRNKNKTKHDIPEGCDGCETYEHDDFGTIYIIGDHDERHPENDPIYDALLETEVDRMYAEGESTDAPVMSQLIYNVWGNFAYLAHLDEEPDEEEDWEDCRWIEQVEYRNTIGKILRQNLFDAIVPADVEDIFNFRMGITEEGKIVRYISKDRIGDFRYMADGTKNPDYDRTIEDAEKCFRESFERESKVAEEKAEKDRKTSLINAFQEKYTCVLTEHHPAMPDRHLPDVQEIWERAYDENVELTEAEMFPVCLQEYMKKSAEMQNPKTVFWDTEKMMTMLMDVVEDYKLQLTREDIELITRNIVHNYDFDVNGFLWDMIRGIILHNRQRSTDFKDRRTPLEELIGKEAVEGDSEQIKAVERGIRFSLKDPSFIPPTDDECFAKHINNYPL